MALSNEDLLKELSAKPIMEVVELVKMLEDEWGVSAAAPVAVAAGPAAGDAGEAAVEKLQCNLIDELCVIGEPDRVGGGVGRAARSCPPTRAGSGRACRGCRCRRF